MSVDYYTQAEIVLGFPGRMLSAHKRNPLGREDHTIYWNACVFNHEGEQIWYGDLDLTADEAKLQRLADDIGTIYATPEYPWRFDGFEKTRKSMSYNDRVVTFRPSDE